MKLYQINLPCYTNAGRDYYPAHEAWQKICLDLAGGYTRLAVIEGAWKNAEGTVIYDEVAGYQVATDATTWSAIHAAAKRLFPDQVCIFWAWIGTAHID